MNARSRLAGVLALLGASLLACPATAQFAPPSLENVPVMEELIARAFGGPPMWKVSDRDTTVYVVASPGPIPPGVEVDLSGIERRLAGANQLILPPAFTMGPLAVLALPGVLDLRGDIQNKSGRNTLDPLLTGPQRARFAAARDKVGKPAARYSALQPGAAAMLLAGDAREASGGNGASTETGLKSFESMVAEAAARRKVRAAPAERFGGSMLSSALGQVRAERMMSCFDVALTAIEEGRTAPMKVEGQDLTVLRAWADGDIRPLVEQSRRPKTGRPGAFMQANFDEGVSLGISLSNGAGGNPCAESFRAVSQFQARWVEGETAAIAAALRRKGHAVAVIDASSLLMQNGVLDRLRRQGFTVTPPAGAE